MRGKLLVTAAAIALGAATAAPASAFEVEVGINGTVTVNGDLSACASLSWSGGLLVGQFTAVGEAQGPGTKLGTLRAAEPIVASSGHWSRCIPGAYYGATAGEAKYVLTATTAGGDHVTVKQCTVAFGSVTCA
jgi:hypothetical protein